MTVTFASFVCVLCVLVVCESVHGNLWHQHHKVICLVNCTEFKQNSENFVLADFCKEKCENITSLTEFEDRKILPADLKLPKPELHCRTEYDLFVKWKPWHTDLVYLVEIRNKHTEWTPLTVVTRNNCTFGDLASNSTYQIRLWGIQSGKDVWGPRTSAWLTTLEADFEPLPVADISLKKMVLRNYYYEAVIQWVPNERDLVCFYDLVVFNNNKDTRIADFRQMEYRKIAENFEIRIDQLEFDNFYHVAVMTKSGNWERESMKTWYNFSTPTCLDAYADLNKCPPEKPTNLTSDEILVNVVSKDEMYTAFYNVTVTWSLTKYIPDYYEVFLIASKTNNLTILGNQTEAVFKNVAVGLYYNVYLTAYSAAGTGETAMLQRQITHSRLPTQSKQLWWIVTFVSLTTITILTILATGFCIFHRRAKRKRYERRRKYFEELEDKAPKNIDCITSDTVLVLDDSLQVHDKWELRPESLVIQSVLGEGAFGLVRRAWLRTENANASTEVAVKMLKDTPTPEQTRHFLHEIDIMKTVGRHPHLVSILGCCTRAQAGCGMMLVVEYCALGDLQNYLRGAWERMTSQPDTKIQYADLVTPIASDGIHNLIINKLYDLEISTTNQSTLQPSDLLSFARQIAMGMEYLSNLKVLHRDLAARNVLVCADKSVKIADFGLSRDVYRDNMYRKTDSGKLPIRWMALESLTHQMYTTQSDVWSFGILLWEIVTLGGNPYPSVPTNALLKLLKSGYRMECPSNCGPELYKVMLSCWKARPKERPTFIELRKSLDGLLESMTMSQYLNLDLVSSTEFASFRVQFHDAPSITLKTKSKNSDTVSTERYVHPILLHNVKNTAGTTDVSMMIK